MVDTMWVLDLGDGVTATEDSVLQGEYAQVYAMVAAGLPHAEVDVDPYHCPLCRQAWLAVLRTSRRGANLFAELLTIGAMPRGDVVALMHKAPRPA